MKQKLFLVVFLIVCMQKIFPSENECTRILGKIIKNHNLYINNRWYAKNHNQTTWIYKMSAKSVKNYAHLTQNTFLFESFNCEKYPRLKERYKTIKEQVDKKD